MVLLPEYDGPDKDKKDKQDLLLHLLQQNNVYDPDFDAGDACSDVLNNFLLGKLRPQAQQQPAAAPPPGALPTVSAKAPLLLSINGPGETYDMKGFKHGEKIAVLYNPDKPDKADFKTPAGKDWNVLQKEQKTIRVATFLKFALAICAHLGWNLHNILDWLANHYKPKSGFKWRPSKKRCGHGSCTCNEGEERQKNEESARLDLVKEKKDACLRLRQTLAMSPSRLRTASPASIKGTVLTMTAGKTGRDLFSRDRLRLSYSKVVTMNEIIRQHPKGEARETTSTGPTAIKGLAKGLDQIIEHHPDTGQLTSIPGTPGPKHQPLPVDASADDLQKEAGM
jgi:hypothetical protein